MLNSNIETVELLLKNQNDAYKEQLEPDFNRWPRVRDITASSNKNSFMHGFLIGQFSGFLNTQLRKELKIKNIYHSVDRKTFKIAVIFEKEGHAPQKAMLFVYPDVNEGIFCEEEWEKIKNVEGKNRINEEVKKISITRNRVSGSIDASFKITVADGSLLKTCGNDELSDFIQVNKYSDEELLDDKINKLCCNSDADKVKEIFEVIIDRIYNDYTHAYESIIKKEKFDYKEYFAENELFKCQREAVQHGYMIGRFYNYRYRFNINILPELSSGNGFVDTVMVVRGKGNSLNSIPIIMEHKQGSRSESSVDKALMEAKGYSSGFQPVGVPFLTSSKRRIYVGVNFDRNPFYKIGSLSTELLGLSFVENYFNNIPEDAEALSKMAEDIKKQLKKIKNTLSCVNKKSENKCSLNKINDFFNAFYGFASLSHQYNLRMDASELINNLFTCRVSDINCKPEDSGLFHCLSQAGIVLVEDAAEPNSMVIFSFYPHKEMRGTLPLNEIKGIKGDINKLTNILESKTNVTALMTDKEDLIIKTKRFSGFNDYNNKLGKLFDQCEFMEIPYPKKLTDEFIEAACSLPNSSNDANIVSKEFDEFFKKIPEIFNSNYFYSGDEKKFEMVLFGLLLGYKSLIDEEGDFECVNKMKINSIEAITQYQMGYNDGTIDLLIKIGSNDNPMAIELKRAKGRTQESECKNSLEKYSKGNAYRELTDSREIMLLGYILNDKNKAVTPCSANSAQGGVFKNMRANIEVSALKDHVIPRVINKHKRREVLTAAAMTSGAQRATFYPAVWIKMMWSNLFSTLSPLVRNGSKMLSSWVASDSNQPQSSPEVANAQSLQIPSLHRTPQGIPLDYVAPQIQGFNSSETNFPAFFQESEYRAGHLQGGLQLLDLVIRKRTRQKYSLNHTGNIGDCFFRIKPP